MPDSILKDADRSKLDGIISQMVANKETDENIQLLVSDFKEKYGQKKNPDSSASVSGASPLPNGSNLFQQKVETKVPSILTTKGKEEYKEQVKAFKPQEEAKPDQPKPLKKVDGGVAMSFMKGLNDFNSGLFKTPRAIFDVASTITDTALQSLNITQDDTNYDDVIAASGYSSPLSVLDRLGDYYSGKSNNYASRQEKFSKGIIDSFSSGEYSNGGKQLLNNISGSIPSMVGMALTGGASNIAKLSYAGKTLASAMPFISQRNAELTEDKSIPKSVRVVNSVLNGYSEVVFDQSFGTTAMINTVVKAFREEGKDRALKVAKDFTKGFVTEAIKKIQPVTGAVKGSIEEMSTTLSQNLVNKYTINPDQDLMEGVLDAGLVGGVMTGGIATAGTVALSSSQKKKAGELMGQRSELVDDLDNNKLPDDVKEDLSNKLSKIDESLSKLDDDSQAILSNLPEEVKAEITEKQSKINSIEESLQDETLSETSKEVLADKLLKEQDALDEILTAPVFEQSSVTEPDQTFEQSAEIPTKQTNLDSKPQDDLLLDGEQVTGEPTNTDTAVETNQGAGAIDQATNNTDVSEVGGEAVKSYTEPFSEPFSEQSDALRDVESTNRALDEVGNKTPAIIDNFKLKIRSIVANLRERLISEKGRIQALKNELTDKSTEKEIDEFFVLRDATEKIGKISDFGSSPIKYQEIRDEFSDVDDNLENAESKYKKGKEKGGISAGKTYEAEGDGILYRSVSKEDYERIQKQGYIDTDGRGAIAVDEGINMGKKPETSANYIPNNKGGYILAIDPKGLDLFIIDADNYIRTNDNIPLENIVKVSSFIGKDEMGGMYKQSKFNQSISEAYHKAKQDGSNPELVKAVEDLLGNKGKGQVGTKSGLSDGANTVLQKAETDLAALKQVENKSAKYEGSVKRLTDAKNAGIITESEFNDLLNRFDDVMAEYTPKGAKAVNLNESIPDEVLDDVEVPKEVKQYHAKEKDRAVADIKAQWAKLSVVGIANNPIQQDKDVAKLIEAVSRYAYHAMMDGSIKIQGKIADKVNDVINQLGLEKVTKQQREAITEAIKVQVDKTKAELKEFAKPIKTVIKEATQVKSDFKEKDLISRLSQFKRRLADEVRGFKKGVKEGKSDAKEKQQSKDDIISGLREEIKLQIKEAKDSGLISNRIKPQTFVGAINRLNNAKTPMQLLKAIDYMSRVFADIDYDNHLTEANNLRSKVKKLAKRKGLPSNISEAMRNIARAVPEDLDDLVEYNKLLTSVIDNVNGASITGIDTGLLNDVANWLAEQHQKKTKERYELLVGEQGFEYESKTLEEMKAEIDALNEEDYEGKDSRRDADESVSELLREDLLDADVSDYDHPQEIAAIEALKSLNISELSDKDLRLYNIAVNNLLLNGKLNGIGTLISVARKQKNFADKAKIADIQATTRAVSSWADGFRSGWATLPTQLKAFINNDRNLAKFYTITGLAEIKTGYTKVSNRITEVEKGIEKIIRKHKELRDVPKRQIEVAVYADLNQWDHGSTQEQIQEQFDGRKLALLETIDRLKEKSSFDVKFKKEHSNYIGLLEDVYDSIKGLKSVNDLTLQPGQMELYNYMRDYYDSIQDDTRLNAEIYNNINFKPVQNYFPRTYNKVDDLFGANAEKQMESKLLSESIFYDRSDIKKEESGSKQSRVIKKDQLPIDKVINLDLVSNFLNTARNVLYDIETQPARTYTANLLASKQMRELTTDDSSIEITQRVANQLVKNQRLGILPQHSKTAAKAMGEFYRGMGNRFALGGISQAVKQSASSYTTTMIALGKNAGLLATSVHELIVNNEAANRLMEGMPISRRALEKSALTHVSIKESDVSKLNRSMEKHIVRVLDGWNDFADYMSLSPLIWGDLVSAKASWMAFYKDYLIKEGIIKSPSEFNLEKESLNRNAEAAEYAEQMTNTTLNSNDRTLQPEQKLGGWFPFTSFAINAKLNLAIDMARVSRKGIPMPERQKAARMVAGHIASSVVLNAISWGLRAYLITEAVDLVANFVKDDEEEEERDVLVKYLESLQDELLVRNSENTVGYIIKDIVFGGIISQVTDPVYNTIKEWITGEKSYDRPSDLIKIAGIYGIPASAIIQLGTKANDLMLPDEQFRKERYGIKSADGSILYVPIESSDKKRSEWARKSMASATALNALQVLSSVSNQEFANISRRLPLLVKKLEDKKYGSKRSLNPKNIEKDMAEITEMGKTYVLTPEQIEFRKKAKAEFLKDNYKTIKENGTDKESEQLAKSLSDTYATNLTLYEFRDKLKEKE